MEQFNNLVLLSADYKKAFDRIFKEIPLCSRHQQYLADTESKILNFIRLLAKEESGKTSCTPEQASSEGEEILLLLNRLILMVEENAENHHPIMTLAISTGIWVAERQGEINELELIVSGIATFANQTVDKHELEELYEISLKILYAVDKFHKADLDKSNPNRPWRLLLLNHCIIATRSDNGDIARMAFDQLVHYLPEEAKDFFEMGMQKVNAGKYSFHSRSVMKAYYEMFSTNHHPQNVMEMNLN